jgi:hypothetical protein
LTKDDLVAQIVPLFGPKCMVRRLRLPDLVELFLVERAVGIKARFGPRPHHLSFQAALMEIFAEGLRAALHDAAFQLADLFRQFVVLGLVGLAVGFESAALIKMKQRTAELMRSQRAVQCLRAKLIGIERLKTFAFGFIWRHQTNRSQHLHQIVAAEEVTVAPSPHPARAATLHGKRCAVFGVAPIAEDAHARSQRAVWMPFGV